MDKRLGTLLLSWGVSHVFSYAQPLPSPHKQRWTRVSRIFSECQLCLGWREGELKENVGKDALFYEVTQKLQKIMNTAFLSPRTFVHDCSCGDRYKVFSFLFFKVLVTDFFGSVHSVEISNSSATDVEQESLCRYFFCHTEKQLSEIQKGF